MQSVLIINSEIYEKYQKYAYFFNWFEDHSDVSVCIWNKFTSDKADIDEMVPQLFDIVKNATEWNAYIVDEPFCSGDYIKQDFVKLTQCSINPYERARHTLEYNVADDPLMQLIYFLGGRGVENIDYINNYTFRAIRPTQICILTPRIFENLEMQQIFLRNDIEEKRREKSQTSALLTDTDELVLQYSEFWDRYEYPPNCRFLVFDMPDTLNVKYEDAWFLLWLATMTLVLNRYSSSELGPYKLYQLKIDVSREDFSSFVNNFFAELRRARDISNQEIEKEIEAIKAAKEDTSCSHPVICAPVYVNFPDTDFSKFFVAGEEFGITKDKPKLDTEVWGKHKNEAEVETHRLFKAIARGKNEAVNAMKRTMEIDLPQLQNQYLTRYDVEDIIDDLDKSEIEMLGLKTDKAVSRAAFERRKKKVTKPIEKTLPGRVLTKTYLKLMAMGVLVCLLGFVPFVMSSAKFNTTSLLVSLLITGFSCIVVTIASFIALKYLRFKFDKKLNEYSKVVNETLQEIRDNAQIQSQYLTLLLNYMEKYQMIKSGKIEQRHLQHLEELTKTRARYEEAIAQCKSAAGICSVTINEDECDDTSRGNVYIYGDKIYLHDDTDSLLIPLNTVPNKLIPPFSFVEALHISEEMIYESEEYYRMETYDDLNEAEEAEKITEGV